ncbi:MAG: aquaporin [Planctomycetota bacterium]
MADAADAAAPSITAKSLTEGIGTFFLVFTIAMVVIEPGAGTLAPVAIAGVLAAMIYAGGHISGAHYNPAVTLAVMLRGKCPTVDVVPYIVVQLAGAAAASFLALFLKGDAEITPVEIDIVPALLAEFVFTFALVYVILNVATAPANEGNSFFGFAIGITVLAGAYAVGGISGGAFNPAVAMGLGITGLVEWADLWVHLVAQVAAAVAAAVVFKAVVRPS